MYPESGTILYRPGKAGYSGGVIWRMGTLFSQVFNTLFCGGSPDETLSARSWRQGELMGHPRWARCRVIIDIMFKPLSGPEHCKSSHDADLAFANYIIALESNSKKDP